MSEREIRERAELGDALCLLMLLWSEDELDEADDDEIMLFLAAFGYEKLYKWQDGDVDPLVRQLLDIASTSPQLLRVGLSRNNFSSCAIFSACFPSTRFPTGATPRVTPCCCCTSSCSAAGAL